MAYIWELGGESECPSRLTGRRRLVVSERAAARGGRRDRGRKSVLRILLATGNIFVSLVLGAIAFGFVFIKYPDTMAQILDAAAGLKGWLISRGITTEYNNWIRVLLEERQLVFMGFTILMRIVLSLVTLPISALANRE